MSIPSAARQTSRMFPSGCRKAPTSRANGYTPFINAFPRRKGRGGQSRYNARSDPNREGGNGCKAIQVSNGRYNGSEGCGRYGSYNYRTSIFIKEVFTRDARGIKEGHEEYDRRLQIQDKRNKDWGTNRGRAHGRNGCRAILKRRNKGFCSGNFKVQSNRRLRHTSFTRNVASRASGSNGRRKSCSPSNYGTTKRFRFFFVLSYRGTRRSVQRARVSGSPYNDKGGNRNAMEDNLSNICVVKGYRKRVSQGLKNIISGNASATDDFCAGSRGCGRDGQRSSALSGIHYKDDGGSTGYHMYRGCSDASSRNNRVLCPRWTKGGFSTYNGSENHVEGGGSGGGGDDGSLRRLFFVTVTITRRQ